MRIRCPLYRPVVLQLLWLVVLVACGDSPPIEKDRPTDRQQARGSEKMGVVSFYGADEITSRYVERLLKSRGISFDQEGAFVRTAMVPTRDLNVARELLISEEGLREFLIWSTDDLSKPELPFERTDVDLTYSEALAKYGSSTEVGRILRSPDFPSPVKITEVERIVRVEWRIRNYITSHFKPTKATQGRVSFLRKFPGKSEKTFKGVSDVAVFDSE